jgi:adenine-specific DNA-methyltransferase
VAIVPRSFCNGPYFRPFRRLLLRELGIDHIHVFESRSEAFKEDQVLQENLILAATKGAKQGPVTLSASRGQDFDDRITRHVAPDEVVRPGDEDEVIYIAVRDEDQRTVEAMEAMQGSLDDLGLGLSTGPVVDFRLRSELRQEHEDGAVPLVYPAHLSNSTVAWPRLDGKKPNAIRNSELSRKWLMPMGCYVLTRRLSSKEEKRRVVAAVFDPAGLPGEQVGFENHLNVFHRDKAGLEPELARGLALYLNSTLVDRYFRLFSGHTQVNAADLRSLPYPSEAQLRRLGSDLGGSFPPQADIDALVDGLLPTT